MELGSMLECLSVTPLTWSCCRTGNQHHIANVYDQGNLSLLDHSNTNNGVMMVAIAAILAINLCWNSTFRFSEEKVMQH